MRKAGKRVQPSGIDLGDEGRGISGGGGVAQSNPFATRHNNTLTWPKNSASPHFLNFKHFLGKDGPGSP